MIVNFFRLIKQRDLIRARNGAWIFQIYTIGEYFYSSLPIFIYALSNATICLWNMRIPCIGFSIDGEHRAD